MGKDYQQPLSASRPEILDGPNDDRLRESIHALFVTGVRFAQVREALGREIGLTGSQYFVLAATASHDGIGPRALADHLHVAPPNVTVEVNRLVDAGLITKTADPDDRRRVHLSLSEAGQDALDALGPMRRDLNDVLFDGLDRDEFEALHRLLIKLEHNSVRAEHEINLRDQLRSTTAS